MLLRFGLSNFRSFADYQEINLTATSLKGGHVSFLKGNSSISALPVGAIYGPNNSGKSNLLRGLARLRALVLRSHATSDRDANLPFEPFKLDPGSEVVPSQFDIDFLIEKVRFHYGIRFNEEAIVEEWLYSYPKAYRQVWFHRSKSDGTQGREEEKGPEYYFGPSLKGQNSKISELTKGNSLFLSTAAAFGHEQLDKIFQFFKQKIIYVDEHKIARLENTLPSFIARDDCDKQGWITQQLARFDTGIHAINFHEEKLPDEIFKVLKALKTALKEADVEDNDSSPSEVAQRTWMSHSGTAGDVEIPLVDESRGTRSLVAILSFVYDATQRSQGTTLIIDELDTSLHTVICEELLQFFTNPDLNMRDGQILFTTHDTNLLLSDNLRRDSIWFTEKKAGRGTRLFSLAEVRTKITDNFERGYLFGRYGGIPIIRSLVAAAITKDDG